MSHHGNLPPDLDGSPRDEPLRKEMSDAMKKLMGEYPNGKLGPDDQGAVAVGFSSEPGIVKMHFPKPCLWIGFTPDEAIAMAESLIQHARAANKGGNRILTVKL